MADTNIPEATDQNTFYSSDPCAIGEIIEWCDEYNLEITHELPPPTNKDESFSYIVEKIPKPWFNQLDWEAKRKFMTEQEAQMSPGPFLPDNSLPENHGKL